MRTTIRNPIEWVSDQIGGLARQAGAAGETVSVRPGSALPEVRRIRIGDLRTVLERGLDDFGAFRSDVLFLCLMYPLIGLLLVWFSFERGLMPLIFPLVSGFALLGPIFAVGLYEISRRREAGRPVTWADAFGVLASPRLGAIATLGLLLVGLFVAWLFVAQAIYVATLGAEPPTSFAAFADAVFTTGAGWVLIVAGIGTGFLFAVAAFAVSVVSLPMLLDRDVGLGTAIAASLQAVMRNPGPMTVWAGLVVVGLVLGALPFFLGLIVALPVLGHATWHLYRSVVADARS
jgi:uncharacterized membrane protein